MATTAPEHPAPAFAPQDAQSGPKPGYPTMALPRAACPDDREPWGPQTKEPAPWKGLKKGR